VGAIDEQSLNFAALILGTITKGSIVEVRDLKTAETVKLFQRAHYEVNVAIATEFAHFCENAGIDFVEVQNAINLTPHPLPVPGISTGTVGAASCVLIDEADAINTKLRVLKMARKINDEMVAHTVRLVRNALHACQKTFRRARIAVFGVSPSANRKDPISPQIKKLVASLKKKGALVQVYDPFFSHSELVKLGYSAKATLTKTVEGIDCILITVGHDRFKRLNLKRINLFARKPAAIIDGSQVLDPAKVKKMGFVYRGVGRGV
jgi:nucleotide sugar dehydrogenase